MAIDRYQLLDKARNLPGMCSKATGRMRTGHNADNEILVGGVMVKRAANQDGARVYPRIQTVNNVADTPIGISVDPVVQHRYFSLNGTTIHNTFDPVTQRYGVPPESAMIFSVGEWVTVIADVAVNALEPVHGVVASPGRFRNAATAGQTVPMTGWVFSQSAAAGESVNIEKLQ